MQTLFTKPAPNLDVLNIIQMLNDEWYQQQCSITAAPPEENNIEQKELRFCNVTDHVIHQIVKFLNYKFMPSLYQNYSRTLVPSGCLLLCCSATLLSHWYLMLHHDKYYPLWYCNVAVVCALKVFISEQLRRYTTHLMPEASNRSYHHV